MAQKFESYETGADGYNLCFGSWWNAQTFTPLMGHGVKSIYCYIERLNVPVGSFRIELRAASGGQPSGPALASGSKLASLIQENYPAWHEISLGAGYILVPGTMYTYTAHYDGTSSSYCIRFWVDTTSATYPRGTWLDSADGGASWHNNPTRDALFQEWGDLLPAGGKPQAHDLVRVGAI